MWSPVSYFIPHLTHPENYPYKLSPLIAQHHGATSVFDVLFMSKVGTGKEGSKEAGAKIDKYFHFRRMAKSVLWSTTETKRTIPELGSEDN